jgi:hypothetical protein
MPDDSEPNTPSMPDESEANQTLPDPSELAQRWEPFPKSSPSAPNQAQSGPSPNSPQTVSPTHAGTAATQPIIGHFSGPLSGANPTPTSPPAASTSPPVVIAPSGGLAQPQSATSPALAPASPPADVPSPNPTPIPPATIPVPPPAIAAAPGPSVVMSPMSGQGQTVTGSVKSKKFMRRKLGIIIGAAIVLIGGGSVLAYHEYSADPNVIWSQSLSNMNGGYSRLVNYVNTQSKTHYHGIKENGSLSLTDNGASYSGSVTTATYGEDSTFSAKADIGVANIDVEGRTIVATGNTTPDVYLQVSGISGLASSLGPTLGPEVSSLNGQWIQIDHNLIADLASAATKAEKSQGSSPTLTWSEIDAFLVAAGKVNQRYVFTSNPATAVTKVIKKYGTQTIAGQKTYHYKVGFVKANVKAYVTAMCTALIQSSLGSYLTAQLGQTSSSLNSSCVSVEKSTDNIKSSDTIDVWANENTHLIYQVQVSDPSNPAENFVDFGLNYKSGDSFPFFVTAQDKTGSATDNLSVVVTLDTKTNSVDLAVQFKENGSSPIEVSGNFSFQPNNTPLSLTPPAGAQEITTVLNKLGLGSYVNEIQQLGSSSLTSLASPNSVPLKLVNLFTKP